jgi:isoquinoline 1-oxidoreductase beta subunit
LKKGPSRRLLIVSGLAAGGGLAVALALRPWSQLGEQRALLSSAEETLLNGSVIIGKDESVTVLYPHADMGVGNGTALAQMLAEELDADWSKVSIRRAPAELAFANGALAQAFLRGETEIPSALAGAGAFAARKLAEQMRLQITGGSTAIRFTGVDGMRPAGAAARAMLVNAAAAAWGVSAGEITVANGRIAHASGKEAGFGELAEAALAFAPPIDPPLKARASYAIVGQAKPRLDIPAKVNGAAVYSGDVRLPGMAFAAIRACPIPGGTLASVDPAPAKAMRGVVGVVEIKDAVAVLADSWWRARQGVDALDPQWDAGENAALDSAVAIAAMAKALTSGELKKDYAEGDAQAALGEAARSIEATYVVPYLAHAAMEPVGCVAHLADGRLTIHGAFQDALSAKFAAAKTAGLKPEAVTIIHTEMGGAFGRRATLDYLERAVAIAIQTDRPVNLLYSREEDMQQDYYRNASVARMRAGLDATNRPVAWIHQYTEKAEPKEASRIPYAIPAQEAAFIEGLNPAPWGPWRSVDHSVHGFFLESFVDELAHAAGADPMAFRRGLLDHAPRARAVLDAVAEMAEWAAPRPPGVGLGVALTESFGTIVAEIAEVQISAEGKPRVTRVWVAADPGEVINPDGFAQQMESGVVYGLTAALYGEITFAQGRVEQSNFTDYPMLTLAECPQISVRTIASGGKVGGAGEPGTPPIAAAVANAIFAATGVRVRELPLSKTSFEPPLRPA